MKNCAKLLLIAAFCLCASCAFKESSETKPSGNTQDPAPSIVPGRNLPEASTPNGGTKSENTNTPTVLRPPELTETQLQGFEIEWKQENQDKRQIKRGILKRDDLPRTYYLSAPITLPEAVPEQVDLDIQLKHATKELIGEDVAITVKVTAPTVFPAQVLSIDPKVFAYTVVDGQAKFHFTLSGLRDLLPETKERKTYFNVEFKVPKTSYRILSLDLILATPPKEVTFDQKTMGQYELDAGDVPADVKVLETPAMKLHLIQVIEVQNKSIEPVRMEIPTRIPGKLAQKFRDFYPQPKIEDSENCRDTSRNTEGELVLSDDFRLLPLGAEFHDHWAYWLSQSSVFQDLTPYTAKHLGIFAKTSSIHDLYKELREAHPSAKSILYPFEMKKINVSCRFGCNMPRANDSFYKQCERISQTQSDQRPACLERVGKCSSCLRTWASQNRTNAESWIAWGNDCDACHAAEVDEGTIPRFKYEGEAACGWHWIPQVLETKLVKYGRERDSIFLELQTDQMFATLRSGLSSQIDDPEGRRVSFLKKKTVQE